MDYRQVATQKRVNTTIIVIHVSEPFILFNLFYKPFGNTPSVKISSLKIKFIKFATYGSFEKHPKVADTCLHEWILKSYYPWTM